MRPQQEDGRPPAKGRDLRRSQLQWHLISDFQPPELRDNTFFLFKPFRLQGFVVVALAKLTQPLNFFFFFFNVYIYLAAPGLSCSTQGLYLWHAGSSALTRDGTPGPPALGVPSLSHWTTREVPPPQLSPAHKLGKCWDTRGHTGHIKLQVTSAFCVPTAHTQ